MLDDGPASPLHEGSCCSPGDLGSSLMRTTDTDGDAVRDEEEDEVEEGPTATGVMVMALFRSRTLVSGRRGEPDPEFVLLATKCEGRRFVEGGVPSREPDTRRICCCWSAAARAAAESNMMTLGAGCGIICTPGASGGGLGRPLAGADLDFSAVTGNMVMLEFSVIGTLAEVGIC